VKRATRRILGGVLAVTATAAVGALSRVPYAAEPSTYAVVRLAWRARGERVEECRRLTPAELERIPIHMRQAETCTGRILPYHLDARVDASPAVGEEVVPAGARRDRPLYVFRELTVTPGAHRLQVTFRISGTVARATPVHEQELDATPPALALDTVVTLASRDVLLVTYDGELRRLVVRRAVP
jgi:hypothetical protein